MKSSARMPALLIVLILAIAPLGVARGQDVGSPAPSDVERARSQFREGVSLARNERWLEAEGAFRRAYALYPDPTILFNLAGAVAQRGGLVEARSAYLEYLERAGESQQAAYRDAARNAVEELTRRVGRLEVTVEGGEPGDVYQLDERAIDPSPLLEVDPGEHILVIHRGTAVVARGATTVAEGTSAQLRLRVVNPERVVTVERPAEENNDALWWGVGLGAGVVAIAGLVVGVYFAAQPAPQPYSGNVAPGVVQLALH
jgi:tetratricopeptide (TPR) repeat protein